MAVAFRLSVSSSLLNGAVDSCARNSGDVLRMCLSNVSTIGWGSASESSAVVSRSDAAAIMFYRSMCSFFTSDSTTLIIAATWFR